MTNDTTFVGTTDGITADNLLKPAKGEIFLLHRDDNNFVASQSDIDNNMLTNLEGSLVANKFGGDFVIPTIIDSVRIFDTQIVVRFSENMDRTSMTNSNNGGFTVFETGTPATTYTVTSTTPGVTDDTIILHVANVGVSGAEGLTITYTAGGNGVLKDFAGNVLSTNAVGTMIAAWDLIPPTLVSATKDLVTQITITLSELADESTITKANNGGFTVFQTGTPATTYAVSSIAPGATNDLVVLTVADMTASAAAGVTITYETGVNGTIKDIAGNAMATDATGVVVLAWG